MAYARAMEIFNLYGDEWNETTEHEGFAFKDSWVGARIGAELIGGSLYEVAPTVEDAIKIFTDHRAGIVHTDILRQAGAPSR